MEKQDQRTNEKIYVDKSKVRMLNANKLGYYIWKRICQDQERFSRSRPRSMWGLYINQADLNEYINDYFNYGMDWDDTSKEELWEHRYWDERDDDI